MIIIGIDPGTTATGYGIIKKYGPSSVHLVSGVVRPTPKASHSKRIFQIHQKLEEVIGEFRPDVMVVESLFHFRNSQSLMKLSQVRGVVLLLGERHGMEIFEYAPMEIKRGLTGYGRADKSQMVFMVRKILNLPSLKSADQADALAMALYHSHMAFPKRVVS